MTKTISAKKKFKKCLRINTVLARSGRVRWHGIYGCGVLVPFALMQNGPKKSRPKPSAGPQQPKRLTFKSGSACRQT